MPMLIRPEHGYVVACIVGSWAVHHIYGAVKVVGARKAYKVDYPIMYATASECPNEVERNKYNCVQRAHQNSLENQPIFLSMLLAAGVRFPVLTGITGAGYLIGVIAYINGYSTGDPKKRMNLALVKYSCLLTLISSVGYSAFELLTGKSPLLG